MMHVSEVDKGRSGKYEAQVNRSSFIDQWRGVSVLMVIANHLILFRFEGALSVDKGATITSRAWAKVLWFTDLWGINAGMVGVSIFFVISGYLITSLMLKEEAQTGTVSLSAFYARRVCRIVPALFLYICTIAALDASGAIQTEAGDVLSSSLFLCNTTLVTCGYHFSQLWSLAVEEQFYLFWPLLLLLLPRRFRVPLVAAFVVVSAAFGIMPTMRIGGWVNNGESFTCISAGVLYALSPRIRGAYAITTRAPLLAWFIVLAVVLPFARTRWMTADSAVMLLLPHVIVASVLVRTGILLPSIFGKLLGGIGLISYSLYLWQAVATWEPDRYLSPWLAQWSFLALGAAWLSYRYVETPFIELGRAWSARLRRQQPVIAVPAPIKSLRDSGAPAD